MPKFFVLGTLALALVGAASWFGVSSVVAEGRHHGARGQEHHAGGFHSRRRRGHRRGNRLAGLMERFDTNKDDKLTQDELDGARKALLGRHDSDSSNGLTLQEYETLWLEVKRRRMVRSFQRLDVDGDGMITVEEFNEPYSNLVRHRDLNNDGVLSDEDREARRWRRWRRKARHSGSRRLRGDRLPRRARDGDGESGRADADEPGQSNNTPPDGDRENE